MLGLVLGAPQLQGTWKRAGQGGCQHTPDLKNLNCHTDRVLTSCWSDAFLDISY